ncbi:MAG: glycosyltransferase family 4 protein [Candidatus Bathyarchaeota archaeon]
MILFRALLFNRWVGVHVGGTETHIIGLANMLAKRGHEVSILTSKGKRLNEYTSVKKEYVSKNWREPLYSRSLRLDKLLLVYGAFFCLKAFLSLFTLKLRGVKYDLVSVHCTLESFFMLCFRWLFRIPYVFIFEGYTPREAKVAKYADMQIAISQDIINKCYVNHGYKPILIPVGVDLKRFDVDGSEIRQKYGSNGEKLVLTICRFDTRKDLPTLVSAANIVCREDPKVKFLIVGDGDEREKIEKQITELGLSDKVIIVRAAPASPAYYRGCDVFVLPSIYEGFGIVFLEAMSAGLPIISTTTSAIPEVVGDAGILVPPKNPELLAKEISRVIYDKNLHRILRDRGMARVKEYDWEKLIVRYEDAYESLIKLK